MSDRIVICLVGLTGAGKSETGNTLSNDSSAFKVSSAFSSETRECAWNDYSFRGVLFRIVDTPGIGDTHLCAEELLARLKSFADLAPDGVDCFLFVCPTGRFGKDKADAFAAFEEACGPEALGNTAFLFTHETRTSIQLAELLSATQKELPPAFLSCLNKVSWRVACMDNFQHEGRQHARENVHDMIEKMREGCPGRYQKGSFVEAQQWRNSIASSADKLSVEWHRTKVRGRLASLLNGSCSREDVENELRDCQQAEEAARVEAWAHRSFGQQEALKDRIRSILHDYEAARGLEIVVREFLQNADDHGARRFSVILDTRAIAYTEGLFHSDMVWTQGPALVFAMDSICTDDDIKRVQQLGDSGKRQRFDQIGRFGLGMNTMYVFSDQPILRCQDDHGHDSVCYFDPLGVYAAKGLPKPGVRWEAHDLLNEFPGQLECLDLPPSLPSKTVFRLPLRGHTTFKALSTKQWCAEDINEQLRVLVDQLPTWMCFLRCLEEVEVGLIERDGGLVMLTALSAPIPQPWVDYKKKWPTDWESYARTACNDDEGTAVDASVCFTKTLKERCMGSSKSFSFMIASRLPADARDHAIQNWAKNEYALAPVMSVAFDTRGLPAKLFSGLPLSEIPWPLHVDGFFDVSTARRDVCLDLDWNAFLLSSILPCVHRDLLIYLRDFVEAGQVSIQSYMKLFPTKCKEPWSSTESELFKVLVDLPVLPLMRESNRLWATPLESYWLRPDVRALAAFKNAVAQLTQVFYLVDCLDKQQIKKFEQCAGHRAWDATLLGNLLRDRSDISWQFSDALSVLGFVAALTEHEHGNVASVLQGTRLLCLARPIRKVCIFDSKPFYREHLAALLPHVQTAASEMESLPGFRSFPGFKELTFQVFLHSKLAAAFSPSEVTQIRTAGFITRAQHLVEWHRKLSEVCTKSFCFERAFLNHLQMSDWPFILTDDVLATGRFMANAVSCRSLTNFYVWQTSPHPPLPHILVLAEEVPPILRGKEPPALIANHVVRNWATMCPEQQGAWAEHVREQAAKCLGFVDEFSKALATMSAQSLQQLPSFIARVFFLFDLDGDSFDSAVHLNVCVLGKLLQQVEVTCRDAGAFCFQDAWRVLQILSTEMSRLPKCHLKQSILTGTRLLCLSTGRVAVFGHESFCRPTDTYSMNCGVSAVLREMVDLPGFEKFPGLVKLSRPKEPKAFWAFCALL